jgi:transposase
MSTSSRIHPKPVIVDVDLSDVEQVLDRAQARLSPEDHACLAGLVGTLHELLKLVRQRGTTIAELRRLFGLSSSEKTKDVFGKSPPADSSDSDSQAVKQPDASLENANPSSRNADGGNSEQAGGDAPAKRRRKGHGRIPASAYESATVTTVAHPTLRVGDVCPGCAQSKLYPIAPLRLLRIVGRPPLVAERCDCEQLRCGGCGAVYSAPAPAKAQGPKYTDSAAAMLALLRYGLGTPLNRLAHLQQNLGIPLPATTQWEVVRDRIGAVQPVFDELVDLASDGRILHNDDTHMPILEFMGKRRQALIAEGKLDDPERTGLFTTAVVSVTDHRLIALFFTGRQHAGENLSDLLDERDRTLEPPIHMCDGLDRNRSKDHTVVECNCLSHGRRHIVDEAQNFPEECRYVLEQLGLVFNNDAECKKLGLAGHDRMRFHQQHSAKLMADLEAWIRAEFDEKRVEPNSGLGEAFRYLLKRWTKLTLFLRVPDAPLENNLCERVLKRAIRHRNNSLFYRTARGARVGDIYMSLLHTAELAGENAFDYLTALFENEAAVAADPAAWLPWTCRTTLAALAVDKAARSAA